MEENIKLSDFNKWNKIKKNVAIKFKSPNCKKGEVWWCTIGKNIGVEQGCKNGDFTRPILVIRVFNQSMFWGTPITSSDRNDKKSKSSFYYNIDNIPKLKGFVNLSQLRLFDNKRLIRKIIKIDSKILNEIRMLIKSLI